MHSPARSHLLLAALVLAAPLARAQTTTDVGRDSATVTHRDGGDTTTATVGRDGASAHQSVDCASDPENERCRRDSKASIDGGGVRLGVEQRSVRRVAVPPSGYLTGTFDLGFIYGDGSGMEMMGATLGLGLSGAVGGQLPDASGGSWAALGYQATTHGMFMTVETDSLDLGNGYYSESTNTETGAGDLSGGLGFQYLYYGELDASTLEQSGFGFFVGYTAGMFVTGESDPVFSHGPVLTLSRPTYNAGTAEVSTFYLSALVLPLDEFFLATVSLGMSAPLSSAPDPLGEGGACQTHGQCRADLVCRVGRCAPPPRGGGGSGPASTAPASGLPAPELPPADF